MKELAIHKPQRWSRGGKNHRKRKPSTVHGLQSSTTGNVNKHVKSVNSEISSDVPVKSKMKMKIGLLNARSICNKKGVDINEFIQEVDLDVLCVTETWLKGDPSDDVHIAAVTPPGFQLKHNPRTSSKGGGVGMFYRDVYNVRPQTFTLL